MHRQLTILNFLLGILLTGCGTGSTDKDSSTIPPHILFFVVDDLRPELGCYGAGHIHSPHIDRLAGESLVFDRAYCQAPVCNPSRMSFLSGLRPNETGIHVNDVPIRDFLPNVVTLPQHFLNQGYQTVGLGKVFHQGSGDHASWNHFWDGPPQRTYHLVQNTRINVVGNKNKRGKPYEDADVPDGHYTDGMITDSALAWLDRFDPEQPFFLAVGLMKPHLPFNAPAKYWDLYSDPGKQYIPQKTRPEGSPEYAFTNASELRNYRTVPKSGPIPAAMADSLVHGYFACVSYQDAQVGRLLDRLDQMGIAENTIIVLFGDHGYKLGDLDDWGKSTHFELDTRVPLMLQIPGKEAARSSSLTELVDLYPTLIEATGTGEIPDHLNGKSLMPLFENPGQQLKEGAISIRYRSHVSGYSVRTERFRLVKWISRQNPDSLEYLELYDYSSNSLEQKNLAEYPEYREEVDRHLMLLEVMAGL